MRKDSRACLDQYGVVGHAVSRAQQPTPITAWRGHYPFRQLLNASESALERADARRYLLFLRGREVRVGALDFDVALEVGALFDADARGGDVADHFAVLLDFHAIAGLQVAGDVAVDDHFARADFGIELRRAADRQ